MKVEFLFTESCSVAARMYPSVLEAVAGRTAVERVDLESISLEDPRRRWHSGTVLVDGVDIFGLPPTSTPIQSPD